MPTANPSSSARLEPVAGQQALDLAKENMAETVGGVQRDFFQQPAAGSERDAAVLAVVSTARRRSSLSQPVDLIDRVGFAVGVQNRDVQDHRGRQAVRDFRWDFQSAFAAHAHHAIAFAIER